MFQKLFLPLSIVAMFVIAFVSFNKLSHQVPQQLGSVSVGNSYQATTTAVGATAGTYAITSVPGVLGSITIVSTSPIGGFTIYDTDSVTTTATTTIAVFPTSAPAGTYTFDLNLFQGLSIQVPSGFNGQFITTYRP